MNKAIVLGIGVMWGLQVNACIETDKNIKSEKTLQTKDNEHKNDCVIPNWVKAGGYEKKWIEHSKCEKKKLKESTDITPDTKK
jgi:hypothetical protein